MRIRDIARIDGFPCGEYNAVTDVKGVRVGHSDARRDNSASSGMITSTKTELQIPQ